MITRIKTIIRHSSIFSKNKDIHDPKPVVEMMFDLAHWTFLNRGRIKNFFLLGLNQKGTKVSDFLNYKSLKPYYKDFYPSSYLCLLEDKQVFEKFINNFPEHAPKNIGYLTKQHFYLTDGIPQPIENILKYPMKCIVKNTVGFGGKDIFILTVESGNLFINGNKSTLKEFINTLPERSVLQEILEQHEDVKRLHPSSINTSRIVTVNTGSEIIVVSSILRIGKGGNVVDNFAKGNIYVPVDRKTGKLRKLGHSNKEPLVYYSHPQTKIVFDGYQLPYYQDALELCKKLHYQLPYFFILGWDIAFTPNGPVVIESNNIHQIVDEQEFEGALKKRFDLYIKKFMENKKERNPAYA
jgi:hypothetical protein